MLKNIIRYFPLAGLFVLVSCANRQVELPDPVAPVPIPLRAHYHNVTIFGDSLSDAASLQRQDGEIGNNLFTQTDGVEHAPITSSIDPQGTIRPMWPNVVVRQLDLEGNHPRVVFPSRQIAQLGLSPLDDNIDYAVAGALTGDNFIVSNANIRPGQDQTDNDCVVAGFQGEDGQFCVPGMLKQVKSYLQSVNFSVDPDTLFILWAGSNDILNGIVSLDILNDLTGTPPFITDAAANIREAVQELILAGASKENIVVIALPDLSVTPTAQLVADTIAGNKSLLRAVIIRKISGLSHSFNAQLSMALSTEQMATVNLFRVNAIIDGIIANPQGFDITNVTDSCALDNADPLCIQDDGFYLFFNGIHPSTQVHTILATFLARDLAFEDRQLRTFM